jgi:hypothetical protein
MQYSTVELNHLTMAILQWDMSRSWNLNTTAILINESFALAG